MRQGSWRGRGGTQGGMGIQTLQPAVAPAPAASPSAVFCTLLFSSPSDSLWVVGNLHPKSGSQPEYSNTPSGAGMDGAVLDHGACPRACACFFWVCACRSDRDDRTSGDLFDPADLKKKKVILCRFPQKQSDPRDDLFLNFSGLYSPLPDPDHVHAPFFRRLCRCDVFKGAIVKESASTLFSHAVRSPPVQGTCRTNTLNLIPVRSRTKNKQGKPSSTMTLTIPVCHRYGALRRY